MQSRFRWQTLLSFVILFAVVASAAGYGYWLSRPFTLEKLEPVDRPTLVQSIEADRRKPFADRLQWNSRGDLLAVASDGQNILIYSVAGEIVADFKSYLFLGHQINDLEWHPSKDILAVAYPERLVLWSADGTIIKQINADIQYSFKDLSWNITTEQLAVNRAYAFDRQYYHQIVLFDATGAMLKQLSPTIDFIKSIDWLNPNQIIINRAFGDILVLDVTTEILNTLIKGKYTTMAVDQQQQLLIAIQDSLKLIVQWDNNQLTEIPAEDLAGDILAISPHSKYTMIYQPSYQLRTLNHQSHSFEDYPPIKFNETIKYASWHPHQPILAILVDNQIQLWQFPE